MDDLSHEDRLRVSVFSEVYKICKEIGAKTNVTYDTNAVKLIAELTWKRLQTWGQDLEHFAKHAKRSSINAEDVKLLVRRHLDLKAHITKMAEATTKEGKKRHIKDVEEEDK